jgi:alpha-1,3-rhamnosyl/mannosyltransferase
VTGTAGIQVDPFNVDAMAAELERLLTDSQLRQDLIRRGFARAGRFTWEKAAGQLIDVYNSVLDS